MNPDSTKPKGKSKPRKLKVYQAQIGFYDTVVSAPSKAAALRAWGTHRDLFADGQASETTEQQAVEAALAAPETPLRRGVGTGDPFGLHPNLPRLPDLPKGEAKAKAKVAPSRPKPVPKPPPPDRSALTAAEAALRKLDEERRRELEGFRERRAALESEEAAAERRHDATRTKADIAVKRERQAYVKAGGRPDREG